MKRRAKRKRTCRNCKRLKAYIRKLEDQLEELTRSSKRQVAPFSKGKPKLNPKSPGRKPGQSYGNHAHREPPRIIDQTHEAPCPNACPHCGGEVQMDGTEEQFQEDIVRTHLRRLFRIGKGHCKRCGRRVRGRHPLQTSDATGAAAAQVGPDTQALVVHLNKVLGVSHQKIARFLGIAFGISITPGGVTHILLRAAKRCGPAYREILLFIARSGEVYVDETVWKIGGLLWWLWGFVTRQATAYLIRPSRGSEVLEEVLGPDYEGFLGHDGLAVYDHMEKAIHGTCNAHLLRRCENLLKVARGREAAFPSAVKAILQGGLVLRDRRDAAVVSPHGVAVAVGRLEGRLERLVGSHLTNPANVKFANHLARHFGQIFTYLKIPGVEATTWMVEQAIRPAVVNRKVCGGNRTERGAIAQACLMSVLRTCVQQGMDGLEFLSRTLRAPPGRQPQLLAFPDAA